MKLTYALMAAIALSIVPLLLGDRSAAMGEEAGFLHIKVGNVSYSVEKKTAKVIGYDLWGSGGSFRSILFGESARGGLDERGNSPGTAYQRCDKPAEIVSRTPDQASVRAGLALHNKYEVSISTRAAGPDHWQTTQDWKRVEGNVKTSFTILIYVEPVAINKNLVICDSHVGPDSGISPAITVRIADDKSSATAARNSVILFPSDRDEVALSLDRECTVQGFSYGNGLCGFALIFSPEGSGSFRFIIDHRGEEAFVKRFGSTTVAVAKRDMATRIWAGPYPVVSKVGLIDGDMMREGRPTPETYTGSASEESQGGQWRVTVRGEGGPQAVPDASWREEIVADEAEGGVICHITYRAKNPISADRHPAICLKLPYRLEGKSLSVTSNEKAGAARQAPATGPAIPYRVGAVMQAGILAEGEIVRVEVDPLRELAVVPRGEMTLELGRSIDNFGQLLLRPVKQTAEIALDLRYAHVAPRAGGLTGGGGSRNATTLVPPANEGLEVFQDKPEAGDVTIASPYWCVVHRRIAGGGIASVRFYNGSREELLLEPDQTSVSVDGAVYSSKFCPNPKIEVTRESRDLLRLKVSGELVSAQGVGRNVGFVNTYEYHPWYAVRQCLVVPKQSLAGVTEVQVARLALSPRLDECYYRRSGWDVAAWSRMIFPGPDGFSLTDGWSYIGAFKRGVEGIEVFPRSNLLQWEEQVFSMGGRARFAVTGNAAGGPTILIQPYSHKEAVSIEKPLSYDFYMGLPPVKARPGRPVMGMATVVGWVDERSFKEVAEARPSFIMYHYLLAAGALALKSEAALKRVQEEIARYHSAGIRLIPYTWFRGVHFKANADTKDRAIEECWRAMDSPNAKSPEYSGDVTVCYDSAGYRDWLKGKEDTMFRQNPIDGVYYDWMGGFTCYNPKHGSKKHYGIDGALDMLSWTRQRLGDKGIIVGHIGGGAGEYPCAVLEGYTTGVVTLEELYHASKIPSLYGVQASLEFMGATPRIVCPAVADNFARRYAESDYVAKVIPFHQEFLTKCLLWGCFPYRGMGQPKIPEGQRYFKHEDMTANWGYDRELRTLKGIDFSGYTFRSFARQTAVEVDNDFVKASVFFGGKDALVILGNADSGETQTVSFRIDCREFGWEKAEPASIKEISFARDGQDAVTLAGGCAVLAGHDFRMYKLGR